MTLRINDPSMYQRLTYLMEGSTDDLNRNDSEYSDFVCAVHDIIQTINGANARNEITKRDIVQCIGIKRTNANDLSSIDLNGGVALYPTYTLMNSHCYCNTRYANIIEVSHVAKNLNYVKYF